MNACRFRGLEVPEVTASVAEGDSGEVFTPPTITEMLAVTANTLPLFKDAGYKYMNTSLTFKSVLHFSKYILLNN